MSSRRRNDSPYDTRRAPSRAQATGWAPSGFRLFSPLVLFALVALVCVGRLIYLTVIASDDLTEKATAERTIDSVIPAHRGTIYDRNGAVLACSVDATTIVCNPYLIEDAKKTAEQLASILGGTVQEYEEILTKPNRGYEYIKKKVDVDVAQQVKDLRINGLSFENDSVRVYPYGEVAGQVIGFCNSEGKGVLGLEMQYDSILAGTDGKANRQVGAGGTTIPGTDGEQVAAIDGTDIMISIDIVMQEHVESVLKDWSERWGVDTQCVMMDGATGEIYAAASLPLLNPADMSVVPVGSDQVKGITTAFEPGSIFKTASILSVMENGVMDPDSTMFCPAEIEADGAKVSDAHEREDATFTLREIMRDSSNVGVSLSAELMGFDKLYDAIKKYNLNKVTGVDYPGESAGYLPPYSSWLKISAYNISFGQGLTVTPIQMLRFYGALLNKGVESTPHFLIAKPESNETIEYPQTTICTDQTAIDNMNSMLLDVVEEGTGKYGKMEGYHPAGKTGTAEVASDKGGYKKGVYNISFIGYFPNSSTNMVCFTGATELNAEGNVSGMFADIMTFAVDRYKVASD